MNKKGFIPTNLFSPLPIALIFYQSLHYFLLLSVISICEKLSWVVNSIVTVTMVIITVVIFAMISGVS